MSLHKSLASKKGESSKRNVLTRLERIKLLMKKGRWKEGDSIFGLPKK